MITLDDLEQMNDRGILFSGVLVAGQMIDIEPREVLEFLRDRKQFSANEYGMSVDELDKFVEADKTRRCLGITQSGKRCKNFISPSLGWYESCFCFWHSKKL